MRASNLQQPLELLEETAIRSELEADAATQLKGLVILSSVDSTNNWLQAQPGDERPGLAVLAERQTAGRGRRERHWVSPFGGNIYLSLCMKFESGVGELGCLPLVVALSASDALARIGMDGHAIRWPNDLMFGQRKLGGCLVEVQGDAGGPCVAVMGIGINVCMPATAREAKRIDQPWTDVNTHIPGVSRNRFAGCLLNALLLNLAQYAGEGFGPFLQRWKDRDELAGKEIELRRGTGSVSGTACGISPRGGLMLQSSDGLNEYLAGEVTKIQGLHGSKGIRL